MYLASAAVVFVGGCILALLNKGIKQEGDLLVTIRPSALKKEKKQPAFTFPDLLGKLADVIAELGWAVKQVMVGAFLAMLTIGSLTHHSSNLWGMSEVAKPQRLRSKTIGKSR